MITLRDLDEAIMECQGERNPTANTCIKLAAFYTIKQHLFSEPGYKSEGPPQPNEGYSYDNAPVIVYPGDSDFAQAVNGREQTSVFSVMDELMETLRVINPNLYAGVMRRLD